MELQLIRCDLGLNDWGDPRVRITDSQLEIVESRLPSARTRHVRYVALISVLFAYAAVTAYFKFVRPPVSPFQNGSDSIRIALIVLGPIAMYFLSLPLLPNAPTNRVWVFGRDHLEIEYYSGERDRNTRFAVTTVYEKIEILKSVCTIQEGSGERQSPQGRAIHGSDSFRICAPGYHELIFIMNEHWSEQTTARLEQLVDQTRWRSMGKEDLLPLLMAKSHFLDDAEAESVPGDL